jgi:hypothetical protein
MRLKSLKAAFAFAFLGYVPAALAIPTNSLSVEDAVIKRDTSKYVFAHFMVRESSIFAFRFFAFANYTKLNQGLLLNLTVISIGRHHSKLYRQ